MGLKYTNHNRIYCSYWMNISLKKSSARQCHFENDKGNRKSITVESSTQALPWRVPSMTAPCWYHGRCARSPPQITAHYQHPRQITIWPTCSPALDLNYPIQYISYIGQHLFPSIFYLNCLLALNQPKMCSIFTPPPSWNDLDQFSRCIRIALKLIEIKNKSFTNSTEWIIHNQHIISYMLLHSNDMLIKCSSCT